MKEIFIPLLEIYKTSKRIEKTNIIADQKNNYDLIEFLVLAMDDYQNYGVSEIAFKNILNENEFFYTYDNLISFLNEPTFKWSDENILPKFNSLTAYLQTIQMPTIEVIKKISDFLSPLNKIEKYFFYRALIKNLNIGLGAKTINKALGENIINLYSPMLADSDENKIEKWDFKAIPKYIIDTKINGLRLTIFFKEDDVFIKTRNNKRFYLLEDFFKKNLLTDSNFISILSKNKILYKEAILEHNLPNENFDYFVVDAELQHVDKTWESSISVINTDDLNMLDVDNQPVFYLYMFDAINEIPFEPENYEKETNTLNCSQRRNILERFYLDISTLENPASHFFKITPQEEIFDVSLITKKVDELISKGYEGAIIKHPDSQYVCARLSTWIKIKDIQTYEGTIIEILPGERSGKYRDVAGKIKIQANISGKEIIGTCGTGFKDEDRRYLIENKNQCLGKVVEFTILGKTIKNNFQSGVFKGFRVDK